MTSSWCSHGTYQHESITSRSCQLLMMGTWLPETCWATSRREIKNTKVTSRWFFLSTLNYCARSTTHQIYWIFGFNPFTPCRERVKFHFSTSRTVVKLLRKPSPQGELSDLLTIGTLLLLHLWTAKFLLTLKKEVATPFRWICCFESLPVPHQEGLYLVTNSGWGVFHSLPFTGVKP